MWPYRRRLKSKDSVANASVRLLKGEAVDLFTESGQGMPAWARLNQLARSSPDTLASLKSSPLSGGDGWDAGAAYLAAELLDTGCRRFEEVAWLLRTVLVPLELALLGGQIASPVNPGQLATLVLNGLRQAQAPGRPDQRGVATPWPDRRRTPPPEAADPDRPRC